MQQKEIYFGANFFFQFQLKPFFTTSLTLFRWSAIGRHDRYRKRCLDAGEEAAPDNTHPLPGHIDPITLEVVINPAISPAGHVMGMATWRAVLAEHHRCPFTKSALRADQLVVLTKSNIARYEGRIITQ